MLEIKVLGPGCANCKRLEQMARSVIEDLGLEADIIKVTDFNEILDLGVMGTPGLVVNGQVVVSGRLPMKEEVAGWLKAAAAV